MSWYIRRQVVARSVHSINRRFPATINTHRYNHKLSNDEQVKFDQEIDQLMGGLVEETPIKSEPAVENAKEVAQRKPSDEFDLLNDFINKEYEQQPSMNGIVDILHKQQATEPNPSDDFKVDVDQNDETVFDLDFLGMEQNKAKDSRSRTIEDEKQLFQNIFESYMKPLQQNENAKKDIAWDLQDSLSQTKDKLDKLNRSRRVEFARVSVRLRNEIFKKTKEALAASTAQIEAFEDRSKLVEHFEALISQWTQRVQEGDAAETVYLNTLLKGSKEFSDSHQQLVDEIRQQSVSHPDSPPLNVLTFPILVNQLIKTCAFKFHDGQLAYSLFNLLKKDVGLYTVACNQDTYNEVLRILWVYHGKSNLYNIEMAFTEMKNNGFNGDFVTFNILKQIIVDYHKLKMGKLDLNRTTKMPIWSNEDDKRVRGLEKQLRKLAESLT